MNQKQAHINTVSISLDRLIPHPKNPNTHDDRQISKLRHLIRTHGYSKGSVVFQSSTHYLIAGHGIVEALKKEGYTHVDAIELDIDDDKAMSFMIADNHVASQSEWDNVGLQNLINELSAMDIPSLDFGFDSDDLEKLASDILADSGGYQAEPQDDAIPDVVEPVTQSSDLWTLGGRHRVLCGDSTKAEDVARLMDGKKADMVFTDPPYGINIVKVGGGGKTHFGTVGGEKWVKSNLYRPIINDDKPFDPTFLLELAPKIMLFGANYYSDKLENKACWIVWDKKPEGADRNNFADCELMWTNLDSPARIYRCVWQGLIKEGEQGIARQHPTQKPIKLITDILSDYSQPDNIILDLFLGSGSTLIACQKLNRVCYGMEISPAYVDVICARWGKFTGKQAVRESDGFRYPS